VPSRHHPAVAVYAGAIAFSAYAGAVGLATGVLDTAGTINSRLPFESPVFGAVALTLIVAVPNTALAWCAGRGDPRFTAAARFAGTLLIGWIAVELAIIRELSWLQPFYIAVGASLLVIGARLDPSPAAAPAATVHGSQ